MDHAIKIEKVSNSITNAKIQRRVTKAAKFAKLIYLYIKHKSH